MSDTSMDETRAMLSANHLYAASYQPVAQARPSRHVAVVTCMDTRIDVLGTLGLHRGDAHVLRNAGGRVTQDVLRSLALSTHVLGVETVVLMQHTRCGLAGVTDEELRAATGAHLEFLSIADHGAALAHDIEVVAGTSFLGPVTAVAGWLFDVDSGLVEELHRWWRP
jgi:carbonic anhydrase